MMSYTLRMVLAASLGVCALRTALAQTLQVPSAVDRALPIRRLSPDRILHLTLSLPFSDGAGIEAFVGSVSDPSSPNYRHFISPEEVGANFGQPLSSVQHVVEYLKALHFDVKLVAKNRLSVLAECTAGQAETAFHTTINEYRSNEGAAFFSYSSPIEIPRAIAPYVGAVTGLENATR